MLKVSVVHSVRSRKFLAALTALVSVVAMLVGARVAVAESVWVQSYERTSQTQACAAQPGETPWQAAWGTDSRWTPSWEQWANAGKGGWTCTRSITWAQTPVASSGSGGSSPVTYAVGDTGPGGGLVFHIDSTSGLRYEMAPKNWGAGNAIDPTKAWTTTAGVCYASGSSTAALNCQTNNLYPGTSGAQSASTNAATAIGMGSENTDAIIARMAAGSVSSSDYAAGLASAYASGGYSDWFLPSKDELNAMCNYSRTWTGTPSTGTCSGAQNVAFAAGAYGFASGNFWSSSQGLANLAWHQGLGSGNQTSDSKYYSLRVRPIRAF